MWFEVLGFCPSRKTNKRITYVILHMLYSVLQPTTSKNIYNRLVTRLQAGESPKDVYNEVEEYCKQCNPSNPMTCLESCEIWNLKKKSQEYIKSKDGNYIEFLNVLKSVRRIQILQIFSKQSSSLKDIQQKLKAEKFYQSLSSIYNYVEPLVKFHLIEEENKIYKITDDGRRVSELIDKEIFQELPSRSKGREEILLKTLIDRANTYDELAKIIPRKVLPRVLKRLLLKELIVKNSPCDRVFYFITKRRPTRKLSPTELRIFHAIPKNDGIPARELSNKVGITIRRTYKYLRRLRLKRHVSKHERDLTFAISPKGRNIIESINAVLNIISN
jgi:predicted transcriptional regulator